MTKIEMRTVLAHNMRELREKQGISQEKLAELSGLHRTYISDIERETRNVSIDNIEKIAAALHVSVSELLEVKR